MYKGLDSLRSNTLGHTLVLLGLCYGDTKVLNGHSYLTFLKFWVYIHYPESTDN